MKLEAHVVGNDLDDVIDGLRGLLADLDAKRTNRGVSHMFVGNRGYASTWRIVNDTKPRQLTLEEQADLALGNGKSKGTKQTA